MTVAGRKRNFWVWGGLVATLAAVAWLEVTDAGMEEAEVMPSPRVPGQAVSLSESSSDSHLDFHPRLQIMSEPGEIFAVDIPEEIQMSDLPPPEPIMPQLPFVYAGKLIDDGEYVVFLSHGKRNLIVRNGDVIDDVWQVASIASSDMQFKYLPLKTQTSLVIGEMN